MKIEIRAGTGTGPTKLAAFDAALLQAGIANFNLIPLSSIIPSGAQLVENQTDRSNGHWGDRLYIVIAQERIDTHNVEAWAGIGWVQDETGKGLFVEHHGHSKSIVERDIKDSLKSLMDSRGLAGETHMKVVGIRCHKDPVCALVASVYQAEEW
jgi:arginine decarboxylase